MWALSLSISMTGLYKTRVIEKVKLREREREREIERECVCVCVCVCRQQINEACKYSLK